MSSSVQYELFPMPDREESHKVLLNLQKKYKSHGDKRITLNERFGVTEKGYYLQRVDQTADPKEMPVHFTIQERHLISKADFIENYLAHNPIKPESPARIEDDKENTPAQVSPKLAGKPIEKPFTADAYIRDVTRDILKTQ